jgi:hypothetical protein
MFCDLMPRLADRFRLITLPSFLDYSAAASAHPRTDRVEDVILTFYGSIRHTPETSFGNAKADVARGQGSGVRARVTSTA